MQIDRRDFLKSLSVLIPASYVMTGQAEADDGSGFMQASRGIIGRDDLSPVVGNRIADLLRTRITNFDSKLQELSTKLGTPDAVAKLQGDDLDFALEIAKPWYLGYVGTPGGAVLAPDDAQFVTYLGAQAYEVVAADLPRTSYPPGGRGWWQAVPAGVTAPEMPTEVSQWGWQPDRATGDLAAPDPAWRAFGLNQYPSLDAARAALRNNKS